MRAETLAVAACHFLDHVQEQLSVGGVHLRDLPSQLLKIAGLSTPKSPFWRPITIRTDCNWGFGRFVAIVHEVIERKFQRSGHFIQRFDGRNGMTVLDTRDVAAEQAGTLFDVALGELLFLTKFAESFADNHGCSPPSKVGQMHYPSLYFASSRFHLIQFLRSSTKITTPTDRSAAPAMISICKCKRSLAETPSWRSHAPAKRTASAEMMLISPGMGPSPFQGRLLS